MRYLPILLNCIAYIKHVLLLLQPIKGELAEPHPPATAKQPAASSNAVEDMNELLQQLELAGHVS